MKPTQETRSLLSSDNLDSDAFEISRDDAKVIMEILADGIYTDKILAVLREYGANAWDAHRMAGKGSLPISVTIPTRYAPELRIRDFGPGLSHEDVKTVYCKYGRSTKRDTNEAVGMLGIGSKSGFAYSDTFTVISRFPEQYDDDFVGPRCGMVRTYVAVKDDSDSNAMGKISLLDETACDPEDTGIEIVIMARQEDIYDFERKAQQLFRHFEPQPNINIVLPSPPAEQTVLKNGAISGKGSYNTEWIAIMGCVPYKVNVSQLDVTKISECLPYLYGRLFFNIGEVQVSASREELKYSTATKARLVQKFNDLVDEYVQQALEDLDRPEVTAWDKRLKVQVLSSLKLPLPEEYEKLAFETAKVDYAPGTFVLMHNTSVTTRITVTSRTRLIIDDTGKALSGYYLNGDDYVARGEGKTPTEVKDMLVAALAASGLAGAPVIMLSSLSWNAPYQKPRKTINPKHRAKMFTYNGGSSSTYSDKWEMVTRVAEDSDVYVVISGFQGHDYHNFFSDYREDVKLAAEFGIAMPVVYGYKTSEKKPATGMLGTEYREWRKAFIQSLLTPDNLARIETSFWKDPSTAFSYWPDKDERNAVVSTLGDTHVISDLLVRQKAATNDQIASLLADRAKIKLEDSAAGKAMALIQETYPLLEGENFRNLWQTWRNKPENWLGYVKLVDELNASKAHVAPVLSMVP